MSNVSVSIDLAKLRQLQQTGGKAATKKAMSKLAFFCEGYAKDLMSGSRSGRMYGTHQASAPGEAPAVDTGNLKNSIRAMPDGDGTRVWRVSVGAEYGAGLEFGTAKIAARPFMRPSAEETRKKIIEVFKEAWNE